LSADFIRRKILEGASPNAPKFSAAQERCPPEKTIRHSLLAICCRFGSAGASPSHFIHRLKSVLQKRSLLKQSEKLEGASPDAPKIFRQRRSAALQKKLFATRHSLFAVVLGSAGASPSQTRYSLLTTRHSQFNVCHSPAAQFDFELEALVTSQSFNFHFSATGLLENQTL
jgi:hypothetical protein